MSQGKAENGRKKEFHLSDRDFRTISNIIGERTGIVLSESKREMVYSRLARRLRVLGLEHFSDYCDIVKGGDEQELAEFTNAITTNLTAFFREAHHFEFLHSHLLPLLRKTKKQHKLRIWSAGCSSGEEPYSLAITVRECMPENWDIKILATDLDSNMINIGSNGVYGEERVEGLSPQRLRRWVQRGKGDNADKVKMHPALRELITFKQLNLMHEWPLKGPFDFIFCRNVVIYFDKQTQRNLFKRFAALVEAQSHLFIGHSESLYKVSDQFESLGKTIYRRFG